MQTSFKIISHNEKNQEITDQISLTYEERFIRRKKLITDKGVEFLVNLKEAKNIDENQFFELDNGKLIKIVSKKENLIEITGDNINKIIWHLGNRHVQVEIKNNKVLIEDDPIILDMILKLKGNVKKVFEKFNPEGGAYGLGRTHSHKH
tara:strand:+ start:632 stop:1078 length:447 start_codon:yes stop_codon:yes gene_type:complete